jgi:hypothetical protein
MKHKIGVNKVRISIYLYLMQQTETILFAPLNWGLGHATRIVPLIKKEIEKGNTIIIAAEGNGYKFLKQEFPNSTFIHIPGFRVRYAPKPFFLLGLIFQMPFFGLSFIGEHFNLKKVISQYNITTVISDNRYGLWSNKVRSILITHQLFIQLPKSIKWLEPILHNLTRKLVNKFTECWVPDYENISKSLSGLLSHGISIPKNVRYIDPLSRFVDSHIQLPKNNLKTYEVLVLISGPEPYRTLFENEMTERVSNKNDQVLMVCAKLNNYSELYQSKYSNITKVPHLPTTDLYFYLKRANNIIARSGYSTIMDLHVLGLKAELIPTPGQTEQEYLAMWLKNK